ncbi:hypothetical protein LBMAG52_05390 [Planctomycetia bacterium]|nr:hypothetical protein LBMAG52_05390 [Planctomycetia bacterium]
MAAVTTHQLPSSMVAPEFGEVNVGKLPDGKLEVSLTILMAPSGTEAEGWQTGVALDGSSSMRSWYGLQLVGKVPPDVQAKYEQNGWITSSVADGRKVKTFMKDAYEDAMRAGHLRMSDNIVEPKSREFISYLAAELDADGGTTVIYWACGADGSATEVIGDFTADQCKQLEIKGPQSVTFGNGTRLLPAVQYFVDRFQDAARGMYVFLTDGRLDDLEQVKAYSTRLAKAVAAGQRNPVKFVLVGMGDKVDEAQMEELDDLETGTDVDLWDHKIAAEMRSTVEIFAEVVRENQIVAPTGVIYDPQNQIVKRYSDGLPAKITITLPAGTKWFELEVEGQRIRQNLMASP